MATVVITGTQWGDEGKGKITDYLAEQADVVVRYQGGNNAGHTIYIEGVKYDVHLIPSGIFYADKICLLGNGMVVDPAALVQEIRYLEKNGFTVANLKISDRAHLVMPYHRRIDELDELRKGDGKIGTTKKGIGPAYMDKAARVGLRVIDLMDADEFAAKLRLTLNEKNELLQRYYGDEAFSFDEVYHEYLSYAEVIRPYVTDTSYVLNSAVDQGKDVLFEGAQATMLDIDYGTYPYVTASNPVAGGVCIGAGIGPTRIDQIIGVVKAYSTRVGDGPFVTELHGGLGDHIREVGQEYGVTTGRARRVGWFDSVVTRHANRVSGLDCIAITRLDILTGIEELKLCEAYRHNGVQVDQFPASLKVLTECEPVYETLPGWTEDITTARTFEELPVNAQRYVERIEALTGTPACIVSVGPNRDQTIQLRPIYQHRVR